MALFVPFRALGYITDDVPFAVQRRGKETFVTVSVGKSWQVCVVYKIENLAVYRMCTPFPLNEVHTKVLFLSWCCTDLQCIDAETCTGGTPAS